MEAYRAIEEDALAELARRLGELEREIEDLRNIINARLPRD